MKNLGLIAISVIGAAFSAGCGTVQSPITTNRATLPDVQESSYNAFLYVTGSDSALMLSYPNLETLGTIEPGQSLRSGCPDDATGDVYFLASQGSSGNELLEYSAGSTTQIGILSPPNGSIFVGPCAADPTTGNIAVITGTAGSLQNEYISVFAPGSSVPIEYTNSSFVHYFAVGYDPNGNLFLTGEEPSSGLVSLSELPKGTGTFIDIILNKRVGPGPLEWDGTYLTSQAAARHSSHFPTTIYRIAVSGSSGKIVGKTKLKGAKYDGWIEGNVVIAAQNGKRNEGQLVFYSYPKGGRHNDVFNTGLPEVTGIMIAAKPSR